MATWSNSKSRNTATFTGKFRHGKAPTMGDLSDKTFTDDIFLDGRELKDITFDELAEQSWSNKSKNSATFSNNKTRN
jgi:hypothetical protein